ncbi:MAG: TIGR02757 family protein [Deltaproteobacteria bacterium]|nr:TIGR02757 family protein [Deltaproteobacteria bacterium]
MVTAGGPPPIDSKQSFEALYKRFNHRRYVHPDPLEYLYAFEDPGEREIVGFLSSSLAYGRVTQILKSISIVLERMGPSPRSFLLSTPDRSILSCFRGFRHRFTTGEELSRMLLGLKRVLREYGSLRECFEAGLERRHETILPSLSRFVEILLDGVRSPNSLLPLPSKGSACKRLNLFLRWMVREDSVDPGGWRGVPASKLIIPLDTHMHRICRALGLTSRRQADMRTALEVTRHFRRINPGDPVRYDFSLTRLGIRRDTDLEKSLSRHFPSISPSSG